VFRCRSLEALRATDAHLWSTAKPEQTRLTGAPTGRVGERRCGLYAIKIVSTPAGLHQMTRYVAFVLRFIHNIWV